jgi:hypothetical protein
MKKNQLPVEGADEITVIYVDNSGVKRRVKLKGCEAALRIRSLVLAELALV